MKKTRILNLVIVFIAVVFTSSIKAQESTIEIDASASKVNWKGYKPTGSHAGTLVFQSGVILIEKGEVTGGSFVVDMNSIVDEDGSNKLVKHLKSKDFFEVDVYPKSIFEITKIQNEEGKIQIVGNITIKGISKEIIVPATINQDDTSISVTTEKIQINRTDYNIVYKSKSFINNLKEKFINDDFDLQVSIVAKK